MRMKRRGIIMKNKKGIRQILKEVFESLGTAVKRYPAAVFLFIVATTIGIVLTHLDSPGEDVRRLLTSFILASILGGAVSLSIKDIFEQFKPRLRMRIFFWIVFGCCTLLYQMYLYGSMEGCEQTEFTRFAILGLIAFVLFMTAVFRRRKDHREAYSTVVGWRLAITWIYTMIIWGGISLVLFAVESLLNVNVDEKLYMDIIIVAAGVFAPIFFLGGVPEPGANPGPESIYKFFRILVLYVIMPILTAYTLVFYIYALRILLIWEWPDGVVGNMVLWYAVAGTLTMYFLRCMAGESKWADIFGRWFPRVVLLPVVLLFISLGIRINAYGLTANRYLLGAAGMWIFINMVYMSVVNYKERLARIMTISLAVIAFFCAVGPFNAFAAGRISQSNRLETVLDNNRMLDAGGNVTARSDLDEKTKGEISSKLEYLENCGGFEKIDYLPDNLTLRDMEKVFGFEYTYYYPVDEWAGKPGEDEYIFINRENTRDIINITGYEYMWDSENFEPTHITTQKGELGFVFDRNPDASTISITLDDMPLFETTAEKYAPMLKDAWEDTNGNPSASDLVFDENTEKADIRIVFTAAEIYESDDAFEYGWVRFIILVRLK